MSHRCSACKNKTSTDQCTARSIAGLSVCGRHARSASVRYWHVVNKLDERVAKIQKVWRGYRVRYVLSLAGPGVLKRAACHNDEELVSMESKSSVHPFNYFAFEESGKVWWFDFRSILGFINRQLTPVNPYTRQPLSIGTRNRLREMYRYRYHNRLQLNHPDQGARTAQQQTEFYWTRICQTLHENGFEDIHPDIFLSLSPYVLHTFLALLTDEVRMFAAQHPKTSRRYRYHRLLKTNRDMFSGFKNPSMQLAAVVLTILVDMQSPYEFCFAFMSALYKL